MLSLSLRVTQHRLGGGGGASPVLGLLISRISSFSGRVLWLRSGPNRDVAGAISLLERLEIEAKLEAKKIRARRFRKAPKVYLSAVPQRRASQPRANELASGGGECLRRPHRCGRAARRGVDARRRREGGSSEELRAARPSFGNEPSLPTAQRGGGKIGCVQTAEHPALVTRRKHALRCLGGVLCAKGLGSLQGRRHCLSQSTSRMPPIYPCTPHPPRPIRFFALPCPAQHASGPARSPPL